MSDRSLASVLALSALAANFVPLYASIGLCHEVMDPDGVRGVVCEIPFAGSLVWLIATPTIILALGVAGRPRQDITRVTIAALALAGSAFALVAIAA